MPFPVQGVQIHLDQGRQLWFRNGDDAHIHKTVSHVGLMPVHIHAIAKTMVGKGTSSAFEDYRCPDVIPHPLVEVVFGRLADVEDFSVGRDEKIHAALTTDPIPCSQHAEVCGVRPIADAWASRAKCHVHINAAKEAGKRFCKVPRCFKCF